MTAALTEMALYQGTGRGSVKLDGSQPNLGLAANFVLNGVQAEPLMKDAAEMDRLAGTLTTNFDVTANGQSQKALVSALDGGGKFEFLDGEIRGVNLAKIASTIEGVVNGVSDGGGDFLKTLTSGNIMGTLKSLGAMFGGNGDVNETTKFTSLTGDWTAQDGVVTNPNLNMVGPLVNNRALLSMTGKGMLDLPQQMVNYEASLRSFSQTDTNDKTGIGGTVRLTGMMTEPDACVVIGKLCIGPGTKPTELVGQKLLGGIGGGGDEASSPEDKVTSVTKGLKGLLGGNKKDKE
jgi:AsmA protein